MKRKSLPNIINSKVKKFTMDEITEGLSSNERARLLEDQTEVTARLINVKKDIYCIGKILTHDKEILPHGMFIPYINSVYGDELPYSTAYFYMRVYEVFKDDEKAIQFIPTKYLLMITGKRFPGEVIKAIKNHPENINKRLLQEIEELYGLFKNGTINDRRFLRLTEEQLKIGKEIWKGRSKNRLNSNMRRSLYWGGGNLLMRLKELIDKARDMNGLFPYDPKNPEHKKFIDQIDKVIDELKKLKIEIEGGSTFFKQISTEGGNKYINNL